MSFIPLSIAVLVISSGIGGGFGLFGDPIDIKLGEGEIEPPLLFGSDETDTTIKIHKNVTRSIIAKYGDSVQFECYASSISPVVIKWKKENFHFNDPSGNLLPNGKTEYEGNVLQIPSVTQKSQGTYHCRATMGFFSSSQSYKLEVKAKPLIVETSQNNQLGSYILFTCTAYCYPKSTFKWYKNGQLLAIEDTAEINTWNRGSSDELTLSSLNVSTKNNDHGSSYKCEIENEFGKDEQVFEINSKDLLDTSD